MRRRSPYDLLDVEAPQIFGEATHLLMALRTPLSPVTHSPMNAGVGLLHKSGITCWIGRDLSDMSLNV